MTNTNKPHTIFWVIGIVALLWNLMGVSAYIMDAYNMVDLTPEQTAFKANRPVWYTASFAIAVFAGALGSIALLMRKGWAIMLFLISLAAVLIIRVYEFFMQDDVVMSGGTIVMPIIVLIVAALLYWYSKGAKEKGWIN